MGPGGLAAKLLSWPAEDKVFLSRNERHHNDKTKEEG
jgi:hypothetical protein